MAQRLALALGTLAKEHDELQVPVRGFVRYMRRNPIEDEVIRDGLLTVRDYIDKVLDEQHTPDAVSE